MQFKLFFLFTALATSAVAAPQGSLVVVPTAVVQLYTGPNFSGDSTTLTPAIGLGCVEFPYGFRNDVSSVDFSNATECNLYTDDSCQSTAFRVTGPTPTLPPNVDNKLNSVICIDIFH